MKFNERKDFTERGKKEDQSIECVFVDEEEEYIVQKHAVSGSPSERGVCFKTSKTQLWTKSRLLSKSIRKNQKLQILEIYTIFGFLDQESLLMRKSYQRTPNW